MCWKMMNWLLSQFMILLTTTDYSNISETKNVMYIFYWTQSFKYKW